MESTRQAAQQHNFDERLAQEMDIVKRCEIRDIKLRQQLRESEPELRDLERKLRQAYISKELACQIAQKKAGRLEEKLREKQANEAYYNQLRTDDTEYDNASEDADMKKKLEYRNALQIQMLDKEKRAQMEYENFLREKKALDEIAERLHAEDEKIILLNMERKKKTKEEMVAFQEAREVWRKKENERINEENKRVEKYLYEQVISKEKRNEERKQIQEAKEKLADELGQSLYEKECEMRERDYLLTELRAAEAQEQENILKKEEMEKKFRQRLEMSAILEQQIQQKEEKIRKQKEEDNKYREQFMQQMIESEKLEQLSDQKRRMRMCEIRRATEAMMLERQQQRAEEIQKLWRSKVLEEEEENARREKVEAERIRLLKEHLENLIGYLPSGVLRPGDLERLGIDNEKN